MHINSSHISVLHMLMEITVPFQLCLQAALLDDFVDDDSVSRCLEAYLLWLFGWILFNNGHGNSVDKVLMPYARQIADAEDEDDVPTWCWGAAVLAATYHGLCEACTKTESNGVITGCPLLLQLWAYERLAVGRPIVEDRHGYEIEFYGPTEDDRPTMGTLWLCGRKV
jgi:Plant mobile domain